MAFWPQNLIQAKGPPGIEEVRAFFRASTFHPRRWISPPASSVPSMARAAEARVPVSVEIYDGMGHLFQAEGARHEAKVSLSRLAQFIRAKSSALAA